MSKIISYLFVININTFVLGYYFYNPNNHELFESSSRKFPETYVRIGRPKPITNDSPSLKRRHRSSTGTCTNAGFICNTPFNKTYTAIFECKSDNQCPGTYKCCDQQCFEHKICVKSSLAPAEIDDGSCEKWPYNCHYPYPNIFSQRFRCESDKQCPQNYKCCQQNCFLHKICSRKVNVGNQKPKSIGDARSTRAEISPDLEPPVEIKRYYSENNDKNETPPAIEEIVSTTMESTTASITTTAKSSWFSLFGSNSKTDDTEKEKLGKDTDHKDEENGKEDNEEAKIEETEDEEEEVEEAENLEEEDKDEDNTDGEENNENTTQSNLILDEESSKPEEGSEKNNEEVSENNEFTETTETEEPTTITTTTTTEIVPVTDKVTVVVVLTPDPNSIESILLQNTLPPVETDDEKPSSTRDPEYEEYYEHYDANGDDEEDNEEKERRK